MSEQAVTRAHLRPLPSCSTCGKAATVTLYNGLNSPMGSYCGRHGKAALARYKASG